MVLMNRTRNLLLRRKSTPESPVDVVYLTYEDDPTTTITVQWHTIYKENPDSTVYYKEESSGNWLTLNGESHEPPATTKNRKVHFAKLSGLSPDTGYEFKFSPSGKAFKFKTFPIDLSQRQIKIASGSDTHGHQASDYFQDIINQVGLYDADLVVLAGDITYDEGRGRIKDTNVWVDLLKKLQKAFIDTSGYMIPIIMTLGNHDVNHVTSDALRVPEDAKHFTSFLAFPTKEDLPVQKFGLGNLKFSNYLQLLALDTGSEQWGTDDVEQLDFLQNSIDSNMKYIIPAYHRPMHGVRDGSNWKVQSIIDMFHNTFTENNVKVVIEGHNHTYNHSKTTGLDENNHFVLDENGLKEIGQGTWAWMREVGDWSEFEFVEDAKGLDDDPENAKHFWGIVLSNDEMKIQAVNSKGGVFYEKTIQD